MPVEPGNYIADMDPSRPTADDLRSEGDDEIRALKTKITGTFQGQEGDRYDYPVTIGPRALNALRNAGGTTPTPPTDPTDPDPPPEPPPIDFTNYVTKDGNETITGQKQFTQPIETSFNVTNGGINLIGVFSGATAVGSTNRKFLAAGNDNNPSYSGPSGTGTLVTNINAPSMLVNLVHPIGTVIIRNNASNPASEWPGTTWNLQQTVGVNRYWARTG